MDCYVYYYMIVHSIEIDNNSYNNKLTQVIDLVADTTVLFSLYIWIYKLYTMQ